MDTITRAGGVRAHALTLALTLALLIALVPAVPAAAEVSEACPSSLIDYGFTDLGSLTGDMRDAIDCVAYYGVAKGVSDTRFDPASPVTRWQMALFLVRTAEDVGVILPSGLNQGFEDIGALPASTQRAINQLAQLDITKGTATTTYSPYDVVTRWQMALFLKRLAVIADVAMPIGGSQGFADIALFPSETQRAINQITELGIAKGTSTTTYDPYGLTLRWQMALFLARMLQAGDATPYRVYLELSPNPASVIDTVTAKAYVRRLDNVAMAHVPVDIFVASGLSSSGRCVLDGDADIDGRDAGTSTNCTVDTGDPYTNSQGEVTVDITHSSVVETDEVYAWVGEIGEVFDIDTVRTYATDDLVWASAPTAIVAGDVLAMFGTQAKVVASLVDSHGATLALAGQRIAFEVWRDGSKILTKNVDTTTAGTATLSYTGPPDPGGVDDEPVLDTILVFWDKDRDGKDDGAAEFNDESTVTWDDAEPRDDTAALSQAEVTGLADTSTSVAVTVIDKFGKPVSGAAVDFSVSGANEGLTGSGVTNTQGKATYSFTPVQPGADVIEAVVTVGSEVLDPVTVTHYTVAPASGLTGTTEFVLLAVDTGGNTIDVKEIGADVYLRLAYDSIDDTFTVDGQERSRYQFESALRDLTLPDLTAPPKLVTHPYSATATDVSEFALTTK